MLYVLKHWNVLKCIVAGQSINFSKKNMWKKTKQVLTITKHLRRTFTIVLKSVSITSNYKALNSELRNNCRYSIKDSLKVDKKRTVRFSAILRLVKITFKSLWSHIFFLIAYIFFYFDFYSGDTRTYDILWKQLLWLTRFFF